MIRKLFRVIQLTKNELSPRTSFFLKKEGVANSLKEDRHTRCAV